MVRPLVGWYGNGLTPEIAAGHPLPSPRRRFGVGRRRATQPPLPANARRIERALGETRHRPNAAPTHANGRRNPRRLANRRRLARPLRPLLGVPAAICSPDDYIWGAGPGDDSVLGPNWSKPSRSRRFVAVLDPLAVHRQSLQPRNAANLLRQPGGPGHCHVRRQNRRQAEWDDHGEAYSMALDGPDVYCTLKIPAGQFYLSLYDFNKDGHDGNNRFRDYRVSIRPHAPGPQRLDTHERFQPAAGTGWRPDSRFLGRRVEAVLRPGADRR